MSENIGEWISIKDRLPKPLQDVLIITKEGDYNIANYEDEYDPKDCWMHSFPMNRDYEKSTGHSYYITDVTHWMPLPSAPKQ